VTTAKQEILDRIARALRDRPATDEIPREYQQAGAATSTDVVALFAERVADYRAAVRECVRDEVANTIRRALAEQQAQRVIVPPGFPPEWTIADPVLDVPSLGTGELDLVDGVLSTCATAIADTGTIVLDAGPGQGRRALTLVPDYHLVVVRSEQIVRSVPDAIAALDPSRPLTWISGPSATSDIELKRVEGVHGPRRLEVIIAI
jgi:L-lactate dehydrogenase complex protein LldG